MAENISPARINNFVSEWVSKAQKEWTIYALWSEGSQDTDYIEASSESEVEAAISRIAGSPFDDLERWDAHHDDGYTGGFDPPLSGRDADGNKFYAFESRRVAEFGEALVEELKDEFPGMSDSQIEEICLRINDSV